MCGLWPLRSVLPGTYHGAGGNSQCPGQQVMAKGKAKILRCSPRALLFGARPPLSLRHTQQYAAVLRIRSIASSLTCTPRLWAFLLNHFHCDFWIDHQE